MAKIDKTNKIKYSERDASKDAKSSLLSKRQESRMFKLIAGGDKVALKKLLQANEFLAENVAKKYKKNDHYLSYKVLVEIGKSGLRKAVDKYDPTKSYKFSTYATWWIRQAIHLALGIKEGRGGSSNVSSWL